MLTVCPACNAKQSFLRKEEMVTVDVRGEKITVPSVLQACQTCKEQFFLKYHDYLDLAYTEYRRRKGMLQSDEIRNLREVSGLSVEDLAQKTGIPAEKIHLYENGCLQYEEEDVRLRAALN